MKSYLFKDRRTQSILHRKWASNDGVDAMIQEEWRLLRSGGPFLDRIREAFAAGELEIVPAGSPGGVSRPRSEATKMRIREGVRQSWLKTRDRVRSPEANRKTAEAVRRAWANRRDR